MSEQPGLIIFDCDGVLVDSEPIALRVNVELFARSGLVMPEAEIIDRFMGRSPSLVYELLAQHRGAPLTTDELAEIEQLYVDACARELQAVDGIAEALAALNNPVCVASSSGPASIERKLRHVGLYEHFSGRIFSGVEVEHGKPAPDLFLYAARRMGFAPEDCVVVEDSQYGVQAARAAGMHVFAYASGLTPPEALSGPGTTIFTDMRALPELIHAHASARRGPG
jgi:HAD superfamily hydrolase (TIGR01509 family)